MILKLCVLLALTSLIDEAQSVTCNDYNELLKLSTLFYEAQRSGKLPANQRVSWRKDSALNDKGNNGEDLTGGYYDAGDYVKFGFPMAGAMTMLAWGGIVYADSYERAGQANYFREQIKWGTDYLIKAHVSPNELYGQVGDGYLDHDYWGRPEEMTMKRPAFKITTSKPGSDLAGETSAALAAASIVFRDADPAYSAKLVQHAVQLFDFADKHRGIYSDSISGAEEFYRSYGYFDELVWAALWLYKATGDGSYVDYAVELYDKNELEYEDTFHDWDSKIGGVKVLLSEVTGGYQIHVEDMCDRLLHNIKKSPKGLTFIDQWGSLRHTSNAAFVCLAATELDITPSKKAEYLMHAKSQMEYITSKTGKSFVVGFGSNYPKQPHHASSSCPNLPSVCDWDSFSNPGPNPQILYGALVGGPNAPDDKYNDDRSDYVENEVTLDYNAGFQSLVAGLSSKEC